MEGKEKKKRKPRKVSGTEGKILKELKNQSKILGEIVTILDNMWRERRPQ